MKQSILSAHLIPGARFQTRHPDWVRQQIVEVTLLSDLGTKSKNYWLFEGVRPDGTKKTLNINKEKFAQGRLDDHFTPLSPAVVAVSGSVVSAKITTTDPSSSL